MIGRHCIKTWATTQGAVALSSAEAEFHAMLEAVMRAKGLLSTMQEMGYPASEGGIKLHTDSSAAKSFVSRRGLGKMRHLEIRDLWLQKQVNEGKVKVSKVKGTEHPADLMTKIFGTKDTNDRLAAMNLVAKWTRSKFSEEDGGS